MQGASSAASEAGSTAGSAPSPAERSPAADVPGGQARRAGSSRPLAGSRGAVGGIASHGSGGRAAGGGGGATAGSGRDDVVAEDLGWKEKYLALFTRTLQLEFKVQPVSSALPP